MKWFCLFLLTSQLLVAQDSSYVCGVGSCCVDLLVQVDDAFIKTYVPDRKGASHSCDLEVVNQALAATNQVPKILPGGSAANTVRALSKLGNPCAFLGHVAKDRWGDIFCENLKQLQIDPRLKDTPFTSIVLCLITPDGQRTFLGFNPPLENLNVSPEDLQGVKWIHLEARSLANWPYIEQIVKLASELNIKISMDLSSFGTVNKYKEILLPLISNSIEIVFCNEDEIEALTGLAPKEGCFALQQMCPIAVITLGERGCLIGHEDKIYTVPSLPANVVDTTGAGDYFAAGFLYAYFYSQPLKQCGQIGHRLGSAIVEVIGTELSEEIWDTLRSDCVNILIR
jgi:sugar/nucleoside kinase (ribokinase family)